MGKVYKVGIYKDTKDGDLVHMAMYSRYGVLYFKFKTSTFIRGWFRFSGNYAVGPYGGITQKSENAKAWGALASVSEDYGGPLPEEVEDAFLRYSITPTFLRHYSHTNKKNIKWARRKRGNWGGARKGAGRPCADPWLEEERQWGR